MALPTGRRLIIAATCFLIPLISHGHEISAPATAARMVQAAGAFLEALSPAQQKTARFPFEDDERFDWHYVPRGRDGLALKDMTEDQRNLALALLNTGLSRSGYWKSTTIMKLEAVLREIETWNIRGRDPEKYFFSLFGQPSETGTWGWRVEGHHLSLNFTIVKGHLFATAPRFLGANPANVAEGEMSGVRTLAGEEDLARKLVMSLDRQQRSKAVLRERAYRDIVTGSDEKISALEPAGISAAELNPAQVDLLIMLIDEYASAVPSELAQQRMNGIRKNGIGRIHFGWAGGFEPGQPHYYRIQAPTFLIEYDNVQNGANHIHTVWRDFEGDFGRDLLLEHYRKAHQ